MQKRTYQTNKTYKTKRFKPSGHLQNASRANGRLRPFDDTRLGPRLCASLSNAEGRICSLSYERKVGKKWCVRQVLCKNVSLGALW
jgi:hypothetical protein